MKALLSLLLLTAGVQLAPALTVSNVGYSDLSHSSLLLHFDVAGGPWTSVRVRFIPTASGSCTGGTGGKVIDSYYPSGAGDSSGVRSATTGYLIVGGLEPGVQSMICPELYDGSTWTTGASVTVTTPSGHAAGSPTKPIAPETFDTSYPDMTGATSVTVGVDCATISACLSDAINAQTSHPTIINLVAGQTYLEKVINTTKAPDRHVFTSVDTANSAIISNGHGLTTGDRVRFGYAYPSGCLPESGAPSCDRVSDSQGLQPGRFYYVNVLDANRFQCYSGATAANGGTLVPIPNSGGATEWWVNAARPTLKWIVIRTSTPDSQFAPENTRISSSWLPKMATWALPSNFVRGVQNVNIMFAPDGIDGNDMNMVAKIRVVGVKLTYQNDGSNQSGPDDYVGYRLIQNAMTTGQIVFDRCLIDAGGTPVYTAIGWDGYQVAIKDSYISNLNKGRGWRYGLGVH